MTDQEFDSAFERITADGWLTKAEGRLLVAWAEQTKGPLVEVGSYQGRSAALLAQLGRPLYCVDPWDDAFHTDLSGEAIYQRFLANVGSKAHLIYPVRLRVQDWFPVPVEFIYLDGEHTYGGTMDQLKCSKVCSAKVVAVHDVNDDGGGKEVKRACLEFFGRAWDERVSGLQCGESNEAHHAGRRRPGFHRLPRWQRRDD